MAGVYIPPHVRKLPVRTRVSVDDERQTTPAPAVAIAKADGGLFSLRAIHGHFKPGQPLGSNACKTLHDTAATPGVLGYMILLHQADPRWHPDRIVFVKSDLSLLTAGVEVVNEGKEQPQPPTVSAPSANSIAATTTASITTSTNDEEIQTHSADRNQTQLQARPNGKSTAIAVFLQVHPFPSTTSALNDRSFVFEGWFHISRLAILQPRSPDLTRMLDQKYQVPSTPDEVRDAFRSRDDWQLGFDKKWAVIKLEHAARGAHEAPDIATMAGQSETGEVRVSYAEPLLMTVNEMLRWQRTVNKTAEEIEHRERPAKQIDLERQSCRSREVQSWRHEA
ncbi:hypothetical protein PV11_02065 [Exophiala sideris]|uniref:Uncharacterized protein n=1 Tax=Exophiala sideris TaxID=1016849 RepID=A0A0D1YY36_9EURO|nr:hypothetical protein PV11_02065 [Exophiala sideris]